MSLLVANRPAKKILHLPRDFGYIPSRKKRAFNFEHKHLPYPIMRMPQHDLATLGAHVFNYKISKADSK